MGKAPETLPMTHGGSTDQPACCVRGLRLSSPTSRAASPIANMLTPMVSMFTELVHQDCAAAQHLLLRMSATLVEVDAKKFIALEKDFAAARQYWSSAAKIQSACRGRVARNALQASDAAATRIQRSMREKKSRNRQVSQGTSMEDTAAELLTWPGSQHLTFASTVHSKRPKSRPNGRPAWCPPNGRSAPWPINYNKMRLDGGRPRDFHRRAPVLRTNSRLEQLSEPMERRQAPNVNFLRARSSQIPRPKPEKETWFPPNGKPAPWPLAYNDSLASSETAARLKERLDAVSTKKRRVAPSLPLSTQQLAREAGASSHSCKVLTPQPPPRAATLGKAATSKSPRAAKSISGAPLLYRAAPRPTLSHHAYQSVAPSYKPPPRVVPAALLARVYA